MATGRGPVTWLVTGGAGYIGAHVVRTFLAAGDTVVVLDDLSTGSADRVPPGVPLVEASVADRPAVESALRDHGVDGVVHLAARKSVPDSIARPVWYWDENVGGMIGLLAAMERASVTRIVLSSTAAVYGDVPPHPVTEAAATVPLSPYGRTKLACEHLLADAAATGRLTWTALRYFNVAGAATPALADPGTANLIPAVLNALHDGRPVPVFGTDYDTPDGSCVRDYIHVVDLAEVHVAAAAALLTGDPLGRVYNVGTSQGASVLEVVAAFAETLGRPVPMVDEGRRAGDPPLVVADCTRAGAELGWRARLGLRDIVASVLAG